MGIGSRLGGGDDDGEPHPVRRGTVERRPGCRMGEHRDRTRLFELIAQGERRKCRIHRSDDGAGEHDAVVSDGEPG